MSNAALRQRRTVPLTFSSHHKAGEGDHSTPIEEGSSRSASLSAASVSNSGLSRKKKSEISVSTRRLEPIRSSFNDCSGHSRNSARGPKATVSTEELKREMLAKRLGGERKLSGASDPRTPSGRTHLFSIGSDRTPVNLLSAPSLSRANSGVSSGSQPTSSSLSSTTRNKGNMADPFEPFRESVSAFTAQSRVSSLQNSFAVRTPFEVDAPRGETPKHRSNRALSINRSLSSSLLSVNSEPTSNPNLSEEQDAWAGIDELLETRSMDDSVAYSTSDILPAATVKAMRRQRGGLQGVEEESVWDDDDDEEDDGDDGDGDGDDHSDDGESKNSSKRSLASISKSSSTSSNSSRLKGHTQTRKSKTDKQEPVKPMKARGREPRNSGTGDSGLFDMFQWSEKDNVDDQRRRKGKLNSRPRKVKLIAPMSPGQQESDNCSLPSLTTIRPDDFSMRSGAHSVDFGDTRHSKDLGSVVTEDEFRVDSIHSSTHKKSSSTGRSSRHMPSPEATSESDSTSTNSRSTSTNSRSSSFANDGLVLDKAVDEYIRKIQNILPTISEKGEGGATTRAKIKKQVGFAVVEEETSPSPTSVIQEETAFDELPSLTSFSSHAFQNTMESSAAVAFPRKGRKEEKKETKPSLTFLMSSIKKMTTKTAKGNKQLGDEEKYFPDSALDGNKSKKYRENRCLLNQGEDGVNWDAD